MSTTHLPIFGAGSQPTESDGMQLDYMRMPSEMSVYTAPNIPEPEDVGELHAAMAVLELLLKAVREYSDDTATVIDLNTLDAANCNLINQVLGEGDVSIVVGGEPRTLVQESVLAGVWRVQNQDNNGRLLNDYIEVAAIPNVVTRQAFYQTPSSVAFAGDVLPAGVMNAPPLLAEINEKIPVIKAQGGSHAINLSLLPQTEEDLQFLQNTLGAGRVMILSRGYGNCRITSTNTENVWWVQYFNSQDTVILNTLEVSKVPEVACAASEDFEDSAERLNDILDIYRVTAQ